MNVRLLIDGIVRQTMVLIAQLATSGGLRAPLAHVAGQVFLELSKELENQGLTKKVTADMFGMALRTYQRRTQRLGLSMTDRGRSLWEAVLAFIEDQGPVTRDEVITRFRHDDGVSVRGVLRDLTEGGVAFSSGSGSHAVYRLATNEEITGGPPIQLGSGGSRRIAIDNTSVYWTGGSAVMKVPKTGGTPITLASGQVGADAIAVDATSVYWLNTTSVCSPGCGSTHVMKAAKSPPDSGVDGGAPTTLATLSVPPEAIAVDDTSVYWTNILAPPTPTAVTKVALNGVAPVPVASLSGTNWGTSLVVDSTYVYWTNVAESSTNPPTVTSSLMRAPIGGGAATTVSYDQAASVVHDGTHLYWIGSAGMIKKATLDGRLTYQIVLAPTATRLAVDATSLYWTSSTDGTVTRFTAK